MTPMHVVQALAESPPTPVGAKVLLTFVGLVFTGVGLFVLLRTDTIIELYSRQAAGRNPRTVPPGMLKALGTIQFVAGVVCATLGVITLFR
ncbi:hypothetical protein [Streptomyces sp. NPDC060198]|uniref:hypothetical protein n=1 Tax=Streptomyces sp. NPDC060198 TaxID=3347070 RepID=UPI0036573CDA